MFHCLIKYEELQSALNQIKRIKVKQSKKKQNFIMHLMIKQNTLELDATGMAFDIPCKCDRIMTLLVPFQPFFVLIKDLDEEWIKIEFDNNYINLGNRRIENPFIKVEHPENLRRIKLPINYNITELLSLRDRYSIEELEKNNIYEDLLQAEEKLNEDINQAVDFLKKYGITHKELSNIIDRKVQLIVKEQN